MSRTLHVLPGKRRAGPGGRLPTFRLASAVLLMAGSVWSFWQQPATSVWDGVYTAAQAQRGKEQYEKSGCAGCHGGNLEGQGMAAALKGETLLKTWNGRTVYDLYARIVTTMPQDDPGSLSADAGIDIVTYLLQANTFPAGTEALAPESEALKKIKILKEKP